MVSNQYLGDDRIVHEPLNVPKVSSRRIYPNSEVSDDIVTRLRTKYGGQLPITIEAADEIERLREQIKTLVHEWELSERGVHVMRQDAHGE